VATLVAAADGTASLYFSNGHRSAVPRGEPDAVRRRHAGRPALGVVPEDDLGEGEHPLSPLFYAGQDVITQIRLAGG
jgi:hypothetical protein